VFSKQGETVSLVDLHNPDAEMHTYEPWLGLVVSLADGQHSIDELISYASQHYGQNPPEGLPATIDSAVERLSETGTIALSDEPVELPYYLMQPVERLDVPRAQRLLAEDGHTQKQIDAEAGQQPKP
jgi:hypothetical protein